MIILLLAGVSVPTVLLDVCLFVLMMLGIYVVVKVISKPPKGGESELTLLGSQVKVKGPAWLVMLLLGSLMTAAPVIAAAAQHSAETPFETPTPATVLQQIPDPTYTSFEFLDDQSMLDLRDSFDQPWYTRLPGWKRLHGTHVKIRPATLMNTMRVKKVAKADLIYIKYSTSGTLAARCLTHPYTVQITPSGDNAQVIADVRSVKIGDVFTITTEVTYWNAFRGTTGDDFTTYTHNQADTPETISLAIIFPDERHFTMAQMLEQPPGASSERAVTIGTTWPSPGNQTYYWTGATAGGEWYFTAKWKW